MKLMAMDWAGLTCNLRPHAPIIFPPFPNLLPHSVRLTPLPLSEPPEINFPNNLERRAITEQTTG